MERGGGGLFLGGSVTLGVSLGAELKASGQFSCFGPVCFPYLER